VSPASSKRRSRYLIGVHPGVNTQADSPIINGGCRPAPTAPQNAPLAQPETLAEALAKRLGYSGASSQRLVTDKPSSFCPSLPQRFPENRLTDAVRKSGELPKATKKFVDRW
jgi:hypothetical protein